MTLPEIADSIGCCGLNIAPMINPTIAHTMALMIGMKSRRCSRSSRLPTANAVNGPVSRPQALLPKAGRKHSRALRIKVFGQTCNTWKSTPYMEVKHESNSSIGDKKQPLNAKGL